MTTILPVTTTLERPRRTSCAARFRRRFYLLLLALSCPMVTGVAEGADYIDGYRELTRANGSESEKLQDAIALWRNAAWRNDDFLAQVALGRAYDTSPKRCADDDPYCKISGPATLTSSTRIESYVWYYLATHSERFAKYMFHEEGRKLIADRLEEAHAASSRLFLTMSESERLEARNRIIYVLSCQGTDGFLRLATIYNDTDKLNNGPLIPKNASKPADRVDLGSINASFQNARNLAAVPDSNNTMKAIGLSARQVFSVDKVASLLFLYVAYNRSGSDLVLRIQQRLENDLKNGINIRQVKDAAKRWVPPFEFYPANFSDECVRSAEEDRKLRRISELVDIDEIRQALWFLQYLNGNREEWPAAQARAISDFQEALFDERTGRLTNHQIIRLIQMAAVNGHTPSKIRLGVLYAKGQALRADYQRAANWFQSAAKQRDGQAMYYLGEMVKKGYVYDDASSDTAAAVAFYVQSALAGYGPTKQRFKDLLDAGPCQNCNRSTKEPLPPRPAAVNPTPSVKKGQQP